MYQINVYKQRSKHSEVCLPLCCVSVSLSLCVCLSLCLILSLTLFPNPTLVCSHINYNPVYCGGQTGTGSQILCICGTDYKATGWGITARVSKQRNNEMICIVCPEKAAFVKRLVLLLPVPDY